MLTADSAEIKTLLLLLSADSYDLRKEINTVFKTADLDCKLAITDTTFNIGKTFSLQ